MSSTPVPKSSPLGRRAGFDATAVADEEVIRALRTGRHAESLSAYFGAREYRKLATLARLASTRKNVSGTLVYLLPGLMGSRLNIDHKSFTGDDAGAGKLASTELRSAAPSVDEPLWFSPAAIEAGKLPLLALPTGKRTAARGGRKAQATGALHAAGVLLPTYLELRLRLEIAGYNVRFHPYDWRKSSARLGAELLRRINRDLRGIRAAPRQVVLVAHSLGGLVARAALAQDTKRIAKVVQLAAPNGGSFAAVQALRGVYPTVQKLAALTGPHSAAALLAAFRSLPSLYEQLPRQLAAAPASKSRSSKQSHSNKGANLLFRREAWPPGGATRPTQRQLDDALAGLEGLAAADERCFAIVGINRETIVGVHRATADTIKDTGGAGAKFEVGFQYSYSLEGDGTVPLEFARWPGARTWYVEESHGRIPCNDKVCGAVIDLLNEGATGKLKSSSPARGRIVRRATDGGLQNQLPGKLFWAELPPEEKRLFLEPVISVGLRRLVRPPPAR